MKRKAPARRNPVARIVRTLRQQKIQSAKAYRRRAKHMKARPENDPGAGFSFCDCAARRALGLPRARHMLPRSTAAPPGFATRMPGAGLGGTIRRHAHDPAA